MHRNCLLFHRARERERERGERETEGETEKESRRSSVVRGGGGRAVRCKLSVPERPTNLDNSRARAYCACSTCGWALLGHFSLVFFLFFLPLWETARHRLR